MKEEAEQIIRYLFGELVDRERDTLEDRIFAEEDFAAFLSAVEKDLIDDYVRNEMDSALRQRFEQKYLISETRREKIQTAMILQKEIFDEKEAIIVEVQPTFWQKIAGFFRFPNPVLAGGLAAVLLLVLLGWILLRQSPTVPEIVKDENENRQIPPPTPQVSPQVSPNVESNENSKTVENVNKSVNAEPKKPEIKPSPTKTPTEKPEKREVSPPQPRPFFATLLPTTRSGETPVLTIPKTTENVRLRVVHDNLQPFFKYRLELRNSDGKLINTREFIINEKNLSRPVTLNVKNSALPAGTYELTLSGVTAENRPEEIKFYNFTVRNK